MVDLVEERGMSRIYRYVLKAVDVQDIEMSEGAQVIHVAAQFENICLWAVVDITRPIVKRRIGVIPTGMDFISEGTQYLGTAMLQGGNLVFHIFEKLT